MIISSLIALILATVNPSPFLVQSTIDVARIIGLPRLKTMDKALATAVCINEIEQEFVYMTYSRMNFIKRYMRLDSLNS